MKKSHSFKTETLFFLPAPLPLHDRPCFAVKFTFHFVKKDGQNRTAQREEPEMQNRDKEGKCQEVNRFASTTSMFALEIQGELFFNLLASSKQAWSSSILFHFHFQGLLSKWRSD